MIPGLHPEQMLSKCIPQQLPALMGRSRRVRRVRRVALACAKLKLHTTLPGM